MTWIEKEINLTWSLRNPSSSKHGRIFSKNKTTNSKHEMLTWMTFKTSCVPCSKYNSLLIKRETFSFFETLIMTNETSVSLATWWVEIRKVYIYLIAFLASTALVARLVSIFFLRRLLWASRSFYKHFCSESKENDFNLTIWMSASILYRLFV